MLDVLHCRRQGIAAAAQAWAAGGGGGGAALAALAAALQQPLAAAASQQTCRAASSAAWEVGPSGLPAMPGSEGGSGGQPLIRNVQARHRAGKACALLLLVPMHVEARTRVLQLAT